jgi:hypothetical protein
MTYKYQLEIRKLLTSPKTAPILETVVSPQELAVYRYKYCNGRIASDISAKRDYKRLTHYLKVRK